MSYKQLSTAWEADLPCSAKIILISLADQTNDDGICWPSVARLMKRTGLQERAVRGHLAELESLGHIRREYRNGHSTIYHVHPIATPAKECTPAYNAPLHSIASTPALHAPPPLHQMQDTPALHAPITVIEPSIEPNPTPLAPTRAKTARSEPKKVFVQFVNGSQDPIGHFEVEKDIRMQWLDAYPGIQVGTELEKAAAWVMSNPTKKKSDWRRFLNNWMARAQERAR